MATTLVTIKLLPSEHELVREAVDALIAREHDLHGADIRTRAAAQKKIRALEALRKEL